MTSGGPTAPASESAPTVASGVGAWAGGETTGGASLPTHAPRKHPHTTTAPAGLRLDLEPMASIRTDARDDLPV
jgi:hypothetical protein